MKLRLVIHLLACAMACLVITTVAHAQSQYAERLALTGKVWGYLKYHHTGACTTNWDEALLSTLAAQAENDGPQTFNALIADLIAAAGENQPSAIDPPVIEDIHRIGSDLGWMQNPLLSEQNRLAIRAIADAFRPFQSCFIDEGMVEEPSFAADNQFYGQSQIDPSKRLLALFRFWNIVNYFSPYKALIDDDWEAVLDEFVERMLAVESDLDYHLLIREFTTEVDDTHVFMQSNVYDTFRGRNYTPFRLELIEGRTIVTRAMEGALPAVGDEILSFDGQDIGARREELGFYVAASNPASKAFSTSRALEQSPNESLVVGFRHDGSIQTVTVDLTNENGALIYANSNPAWQRFDLDGCQLGYVDMARLQTVDIDWVMNTFRPMDGIVFDIRNYPNATLWRLVDYLFTGPIHIANFYIPRLNYPGATRPWVERIGRGTPAPYNGRLLILFDEKTISQAEYTIMGLEQHPGSVKIGSQTSGADGNVTFVYLPGGITVAITGLGVYYPDGTPTQRIGIVPDLFVTPTIEGVRDGVDEVLQTALDCDNVLDANWPADPRPPSAVYWDPAHNGHGFDLSDAGPARIVVNYTYRPDGTPIWYLATGSDSGGVFELHDQSYAAYTYDYATGEATDHRVDSAKFTLDFKRGPLEIGCATDNPSARESPASLDWKHGDQSTRWCPERYRFDPASPVRNVDGLWYAGEADRGWGMTIRLQGQTLFLVLYYYDRAGQPTWAIANGPVSPNWPDDGPLVLDLYEMQGYCFSCERQPVESRIIGSIELSIRSASRSFLEDNWVSMEAFAGEDEQAWSRDPTPIVILSDPVTH